MCPKERTNALGRDPDCEGAWPPGVPLDEQKGPHLGLGT